MLIENSWLKDIKRSKIISLSVRCKLGNNQLPVVTQLLEKCQLEDDQLLDKSIMEDVQLLDKSILEDVQLKRIRQLQRETFLKHKQVMTLLKKMQKNIETLMQ